MKTPALVPVEATTSLPSHSSIGPREVIEDLYANKSPRTIEAYARDLLTFAEYLNVDSVTGAARIFFSKTQGEAHRIAVGFKQFLVDQRKLKPNSVNRHLASVRSLAHVHRHRALALPAHPAGPTL